MYGGCIDVCHDQNFVLLPLQGSFHSATIHDITDAQRGNIVDIGAVGTKTITAMNTLPQVGSLRLTNPQILHQSIPC